MNKIEKNAKESNKWIIDGHEWNDEDAVEELLKRWREKRIEALHSKEES